MFAKEIIIDFSVCTDGKIVSDCACHKTCEDMANPDYQCPTECQKDCDCPEGEVMDYDGKCVPEPSCPCYDADTDIYKQVC